MNTGITTGWPHGGTGRERPDIRPHKGLAAQNGDLEIEVKKMKASHFRADTLDEIITKVLDRSMRPEEYPLADSTRTRYRQICARLLNGYSGSDVLGALSARVAQAASSGEYSKATFRLLKSAVMHEFTDRLRVMHEGGADIEDIGVEADKLRALEGATEIMSSEKRGKTSSTKAKHFSREIIQAIHDEAESRDINSAQGQSLYLLNAFVRANILLGLRPIEWLNTEIKYDEIKNVHIFRVVNAKHSHGRANGDAREILLNKISEKELASIMHFRSIMETAKENTEPEKYIENMSAIFENMNNCLRRLIYRKFPGISQRPTIYSTRHQVVSDAKAAGMPAESIAAFFGHASIKTAGKHYGVRHKGSRRPFRFQPSKESIKAVRSHLKRVGIPATSIPQHVLDQAQSLYEQLRPAPDAAQEEPNQGVN